MTKTWWKESVVYQIYPRSFNDSNGDGIGDLQGVIEKLDYLQSLGIDVIWLSPVYPSPNDDNGYDVSDYLNIQPEFGTMEDYDELLAGVHARGMKLVMDLVGNHTSDEHQWFVESKSSKDNPKRDYYIWRDGADGHPPNNWQSFFGGDAWNYDASTDQYYLRLFTGKQPDLNWENQKVREEIYDLMRFWLDKGIDGFRMDVISLISKKNYEDTPHLDFNETIAKVYANGPKIHDYLQEMNREVMARYDMMTVGEGPGITLETGLDYVDESRKELDMIFHFDHMFIDHGPGGKFDPVHYDFVHFKQIFRKWDELLDGKGWNSIFLGNHDFPRMVSRFANDQEFHKESAKLLALMLLTMRGTPYIYQGDEIGMTNVAFESAEDYRDVETLNLFNGTIDMGKSRESLMEAIHWQGRDNARTPVQWSADTNAGFTNGDPWIKVNPNHKELNVEDQEADPTSILHFYRKMITIRKQYPALVYGDFSCLSIDHPAIFAYYRQDEEYKLLVLLNFSSESIDYRVDENLSTENLVKIVSNYRVPMGMTSPRVFTLQPWESTLYKVK